MGPTKPSRIARRRRSAWAISIYTGDSPISLSSPAGLLNPVFTDEHVTDFPADFVADPFMVWEGGQWWMFYEVFNGATARGEIGLATSTDGFAWQYAGLVLREPFHLSYPYVFRSGEDYYMIPETLDLGAIQVYRAEPFPNRWRPIAKLMEGSFADSSIFQHQDRWWMFSCTNHSLHDTVCLYQSPELLGPWTAHPSNPIVEGDRTRARPGGRVTDWNGRLLRFAQDCVPQYGTHVRVFEIEELTPTTYRERELPESPILSPGNDWNRSGMHHVDPHLLPGGRWIACVDGYYMRDPEP